MQQFSKRDIATALNLPVRTITFWTDFGLVLPDISPSQGKGKARLYSRKNLIQFAMINCLSRQIGISLDDVQKIMLTLNKGHYVRPKGERIDFSDFFTDDQWGVTKELCYIQKQVEIGKYKAIHQRDFYIEIQFECGPEDQPVEPKLNLTLNSFETRIISLGKIRDYAMAKLEIDRKEYFEEMEIPF